MKKLLLFIASIAIFMGANAQTGTKSLMLKAGYQTDYKRFGLGVEGRYNITDNIRLAPDVTFFLPKNHTTGLDINLNAHYVLDVQDGLSIYPLAGIGVINNRISSFDIGDGAKIKSFGSTDFGFNLGAGASYDLSSNSYANFEFKYTFQDVDCASIMVGYGVKF
ncbi:MAG: porin family protein [Prevotella sp.]|jgi:outer membrane protein X|nr:porin family protein [Prevotella sp.]